MFASDSVPNDTPKVAKIHRYSYTRKSVDFLHRFLLLHHAYRQIGLTEDDGFDTKRLYNLDPLLQINSSNSETESSTGCISRHFVRMAHAQ